MSGVRPDRARRIDRLHNELQIGSWLLKGSSGRLKRNLQIDDARVVVVSLGIGVKWPSTRLTWEVQPGRMFSRRLGSFLRSPGLPFHSGSLPAWIRRRCISG